MANFARRRTRWTGPCTDPSLIHDGSPTIEPRTGVVSHSGVLCFNMCRRYMPAVVESEPEVRVCLGVRLSVA